jgi:hypothetical protein
MVKISKISAKTPVEDAETHPKAKQIDAKGRRSRQKEVGEKTKRKRKVRPRAKTWEEKRCFGWALCFLLPCWLLVACAVVGAFLEEYWHTKAGAKNTTAFAPPKPDAKPHEESGEQSKGGQKKTTGPKEGPMW